MTKRITVRFSDQEEQTVRAFADPERQEAAVLVEAAAKLGIPITPGASEATVIRALFATGAATLRERVLERGYHQVADRYDEVHDADEAMPG